MNSVSIDVIGPFWLAMKREFYGIQGFHINIKLPMLSSNIFIEVSSNGALPDDHWFKKSNGQSTELTWN